MNQIIRAQIPRPSFRHGLLLAFTIALVTFVAAISALGQTTSPNDGTTPSGLTPGAPAGSYALSGFENVNLYNGNLNFHLPLLPVGGRGGAGYAITLGIDNKDWNVRTVENPDPDVNPGVTGENERAAVAKWERRA